MLKKSWHPPTVTNYTFMSKCYIGAYYAISVPKGLDNYL